MKRLWHELRYGWKLWLFISIASFGLMLMTGCAAYAVADILVSVTAVTR